MMDGFFLVVEGVDGCGKTTHAQIIYEVMKEEYGENKIFYFSFPNKEGCFWGEINEFLKGRDIPYCDVYRFFIRNREEQYSRIQEIISSGGIVICDRFSLSGLIYALAEIRFSEKKELSTWEILSDYNHAIVPDLTVILTASEEKMAGTFKKRGEHERYDQVSKKTLFIKKCFERMARSHRKESGYFFLDTGSGSVLENAKKIKERLDEEIENKKWYQLLVFLQFSL